jgi:hypothetical protein
MPVEHDRSERLISERADGERLSRHDLVDLERHLETCAECRAFERGVYRLRETTRFRVAPAVPDLVAPIMAAVEREAETAPRHGSLRVVRPGMHAARRRRSRAWIPLVAAAVVGALVGSLVVGGPFGGEGERGSSALAATDVANGLLAAAPTLDAYAARFTITEQHLSPDVPERTLDMRVWFDAPERLRLDVRDRTTYPRPTTPTDLELIVDGSQWYSSGPTACPSSRCPQRELRIRNRAPFSSSAPAPTDLVLPMTALADPEGVSVLGRGTVLGRPAVEVEIPFERAGSLFPFLSLGGRWRPFFPNDRVRIWLDERDWFPLRWQVFPAPSPRRDAWALRFGLPEEPAADPIFEVAATSVGTKAPPATVFQIPSTTPTQDQGARATALAQVEQRTGFEPVTPADVAGLDLYRVVVPESDRESLLTYADGISFLKVGETRSWSGDAPFGPVGSRAQEVALGEGVGYYEPATADHGRRLAIHAAGTDLYVESNLPRSEFLQVASSIPVDGLPMPREWRVSHAAGATVERVSLDEARAQAPFPIELPASLPAGVGLASVERSTIADATAVTLYFRDEQSDLASSGFRLHLEPAAELPPASSARQLAVAVGEATGRWVPTRSLLEWVSDGLYRSLDGPGLTLEEALAIAGSIPGGAAG